MNLKDIKPIIVGYGRMGHEVEKALKAHGNNRYQIVDSAKMPNVDFSELSGLENHSRTFSDDVSVDIRQNTDRSIVAIDFTQTDQVLKNVEWYAQNGVNAVIGTTGWEKELPKVKKLVKQSGIGLVYASNYAILVQIYNYINRVVAAQMAEFLPTADFAVHETHHNGKADAPSGTAKSLLDGIIRNFPMKTHMWTPKSKGETKPGDAVTVSVMRLMGVTGEHDVVWATEDGAILKLHEHAGGRHEFANGAVVAAQFIAGRQGLYDWEKVLKGRFAKNARGVR
ncbi:MAG: 4-hydroxy-tetrahydrodipicolinate reductase [Rickettsiales bacterium]|jgi:4-hydroxy-tetrahydrodipicolinate reductase|nr:4-hydroxy-tetrahydrodipicolinate reductase [Rickettsiales bacterium]